MKRLIKGGGKRKRPHMHMGPQRHRGPGITRIEQRHGGGNLDEEGHGIPAQGYLRKAYVYADMLIKQHLQMRRRIDQLKTN